MRYRSVRTTANRRARCLVVLLTLVAGAAFAQTPVAPLAAASAAQPAASPADAPSADASTEPAVQHGKVLFSRSLDADAEAQPAAQPALQPAASANPSLTANDALPTASSQGDSLAVSDAERSALTFTDYDLDVHLTPTTAGIAVRAVLAVRNDGAQPLTRLTLQISSSLHWEAISARSLSGAGFVPKSGSTIPDGIVKSVDATVPLAFTAHLVNTDADHTGLMSEAVVTLAQPLVPGASISLDALYSGAIPPSAERLERIGAPDNQAQQVDWDSIGSGSTPGTTGLTALRGFGNVLWIPASAAPAFLGEGDRLAQLVGSQRQRQSAATIRLRLAVEYKGDPPDAAFFCGRREPLKAISDNANLPAAESSGVATALFETELVGFRSPSLFVTDRPASQTGTPDNPLLIAAVTDHDDTLAAYSAAAALVEPLLTDWFGARPLVPLTLIDHAGQPFEDDALLVRPMRAATAATLAPALAHSLTHAWIGSNHAWIDEGLAQFVGLLWIERSSGRAAALDALQKSARQIALAEPEIPAIASNAALGVSANTATGVSANDSSSQASNSQAASTLDSHTSTFTVSPAGESLAAATGDVYFRAKAAAVWWMLREMVGDDALKQALKIYRQDGALDRDSMGLERVLEKTSGKDLRWFFDDWVYRDRGLPALTIVNVTPSQILSRGGLPSGWLVAIELRNDGAAAVEVPITVRSSSAVETRRLRIAGRSNVSTRIVFASRPERVEVNDGSIPEAETSVHTRQIVLPDPRPAASHPPSR